MMSGNRVKEMKSPLVFWLGVVIFVASLLAGIFRSLVRYHAIPGVGVEYISELRMAFQDQGYQPTLPWMQTAVQIDMDNDTTARELLLAARQAGDVATAVFTLERLVRLRPEDAQVRTELVSVLLTQGRVIEALAHGEVARRLDPNAPVVYTNLGAAYLGLDLKTEAAAAYRKSLRLDPTNESARHALEFPLRGY